MDKEHSGFVTREEIRQFCRCLNYEMIADRYFDCLDKDGHGKVAYQDVREALGPHITAGFVAPKKDAGGQRLRVDPEADRRKAERQELLRISALLGNAAWKRFKTVKACFSLCDQDYTGRISREEMRSVFRRLHYRDDNLADRFFDLLDVDRAGYVEYDEVATLLAPYIQPGFEGGSQDLTKVRDPNVRIADVNRAKARGTRARSSPQTAQGGANRSGNRENITLRTPTTQEAMSKATQTSSTKSSRPVK
jgi:Ca2+-binding EF-hand superfamily protein